MHQVMLQMSGSHQEYGLLIISIANTKHKLSVTKDVNIQLGQRRSLFCIASEKENMNLERLIIMMTALQWTCDYYLEYTHIKDVQIK